MSERDDSQVTHLLTVLDISNIAERLQLAVKRLYLPSAPLWHSPAFPAKKRSYSLSALVRPMIR
jgi:hypothetical protein